MINHNKKRGSKMSKELPQTLRPGQIVALKHDGKLMAGVRVTCWNDGKSRYEGMVQLADTVGTKHAVPLTFGYADVTGVEGVR